MTTPIEYSDPVKALAQYEESISSYDADTWIDFVAEFELTAEHIPELIQLAQDLDGAWAARENDYDVWEIPVLNAIQALGQLGAVEAIPPLLDVLNRNEIEGWDSDELFEYIPSAIGLMGPDALAPIANFIDDTLNSVYARAGLADAFEYIVARHPEQRDAAVELATTLLSHHAKLDRWINSTLVGQLVKLEAVESADVIEAVFEAGDIDLSIHGDWEEVQILLGLLEERITPVPEGGWHGASEKELLRMFAGTGRPTKQVRSKKQFKKVAAAKKKAKKKKKKKRKR